MTWWATVQLHYFYAHPQKYKNWNTMNNYFFEITVVNFFCRLVTMWNVSWDPTLCPCIPCLSTSQLIQVAALIMKHFNPLNKLYIKETISMCSYPVSRRMWPYVMALWPPMCRTGVNAYSSPRIFFLPGEEYSAAWSLWLSYKWSYDFLISSK